MLCLESGGVRAPDTHDGPYVAEADCVDLSNERPPMLLAAREDDSDAEAELVERLGEPLASVENVRREPVDGGGARLVSDICVNL